MAAETAATSASASQSAGRPEDGAAGAFVGRLFRAHNRMVLGLCRLLLRDPVEAEDAAQQTFLSAHRALVGGAVPRDPAAWLAAIARNECRARIRERMRAPLELPELPDDVPDPLAAAIRASDMNALWAALSELPRRQRRAFLLRELGGLSYSELGVALGVTRPAVESLLFRARQTLRESLATAALLPTTLRDQVAQLFQRLTGAGAGGSLPIAAKIAVVTAGIGLGTAGLVALPRHYTHPRPAERSSAQHSRGMQAVVSGPQALDAAAPRREESPEGRPQGGGALRSIGQNVGVTLPAPHDLDPSSSTEEHPSGGDDGSGAQFVDVTAGPNEQSPSGQPSEGSSSPETGDHGTTSGSSGESSSSGESATSGESTSSGSSGSSGGTTPSGDSTSTADSGSSGDSLSGDSGSLSG